MQEIQETWVRSLGWEDPLEEEMAIHSSILAWKIPWTEEPGGLQSMGFKELDMTEHACRQATKFGAFFHIPWFLLLRDTKLWKIPWRRKWQPTPVFLPGESHGWRSLVGYSPWGRKESDTTEWLHFHFHCLFQPLEMCSCSEASEKIPEVSFSLPPLLQPLAPSAFHCLLAPAFAIHCLTLSTGLKCLRGVSQFSPCILMGMWRPVLWLRFQIFSSAHSAIKISLNIQLFPSYLSMLHSSSSYITDESNESTLFF